jgi:hypothetical protein
LSLLRARWWTLPLAIWAVSRAVGALILLVESHRQVAMGVGGGIWMNAPSPASPGYFTLVTNYDGQYYEQIAQHGYPHVLPPGTDTPVGKNAWAFYPLFPALCRLVMLVTSASFGVAASVVSLLCGALAALLLFRMVSETGGRWVAGVSTLALCLFPAAVLLQTAYTEALALLLILAALWCLRRRWYAAVAGVAVVLALSRPIAPALAAVIALHWLARWWQARRGGEAFPVRERVAAGAAVVVAGLSVGIWPAVAAIVTGDLHAYTETEEAWSHGARHYPSWLAQSVGLTGHVGAGLLGLLIVVIVVALVLQRRARVWGSELRWWAPVYTLFLYGSTRPNSAMVRMMMLAIVPFWQPPAAVPPTRRRAVVTVAVVAVVGIALQWAWVHWFFVYSQPKPDFGP